MTFFVTKVSFNVAFVILLCYICVIKSITHDRQITKSKRYFLQNGVYKSAWLSRRLSHFNLLTNLKLLAPCFHPA